MKCPACKQPLIVVEREGIEVDWCPDCHGIWFDVDEINILAAKAGKDLSPDALGKAIGDPDEKPRRCPRCHHKMEKVAPVENPDLQLDRCSNHGLWFDAGELGALMRALSAGDSKTATVVEFLDETFTSKRESSP